MAKLFLALTSVDGVSRVLFTCLPPAAAAEMACCRWRKMEATGLHPAGKGGGTGSVVKTVIAGYSVILHRQQKRNMSQRVNFHELSFSPCSSANPLPHPASLPPPPPPPPPVCTKFNSMDIYHSYCLSVRRSVCSSVCLSVCLSFSLRPGVTLCG